MIKRMPLERIRAPSGHDNKPSDEISANKNSKKNKIILTKGILQ